VVFSDHHTAYSGHRQNFFAKNANLYERVLSEYSSKGYTLIENGDMYELVIQEPTTSWVNAVTQALASKDPWGSLKASRKKFRLQQLGLILNTYKETVYGAINSDFHRVGRYIAIAGNHDWDLGIDADLITLLRQNAYADVKITDVVVLEDSRQLPVAIISHGHQFDEVSHPAYAYCLGEAYSESSAWAFQGADRNWTWNDDVSEWATGNELFRNKLVSAKPGKNSDAEKNIIELLFGHEIAWEYFEEDTGKETDPEWFKFRHMNEWQLAEKYKEQFGTASPPLLILGHSHEVRSNALDSSGKAFGSYINTGSAGRFENLIWGTEIVNGVATLISWHFNEGPGGSTLVRNVYTGSTSGTLSETHQSLPNNVSRRLLLNFFAHDSTRR
jgi:hypothetical protein